MTGQTGEPTIRSHHLIFLREAQMLVAFGIERNIDPVRALRPNSPSFPQVPNQ
jgi:hypothetical protein